MPESQRTTVLQMVDSASVESGIDFCSVGMASAPEHIEHMAHLLEETRILNASADVGCTRRGLDRGAIRAAARAICCLALNTDNGFGNFRFGAGCCLGDGTPFFPGSYHEGDQPYFSIGLENSDLLVKAFSKAENLETARERLFELLLSEYRLVEETALSLSEALNLAYRGLDTSIAPSVHADESVVCAFRGVGVEFGRHGTLAACGSVTDVLKSLPVKQVGYCGIMLPLLEDDGLAKAADEGQFGVTELLAYSSVCGVGVDMVPVAGDVSLLQLESLMLDVGVMALKLKKPLSVRVLPVPGKQVGERTQFQSPYICNSRVMSL
jgi:uncharacterized protein (UPF0210 family)